MDSKIAKDREFLGTELKKRGFKDLPDMDWRCNRKCNAIKHEYVRLDRDIDGLIAQLTELKGKGYNHVELPDGIINVIEYDYESDKDFVERVVEYLKED